MTAPAAVKSIFEIARENAAAFAAPCDRQPPPPIVADPFMPEAHSRQFWSDWRFRLSSAEGAGLVGGLKSRREVFREVETVERSFEAPAGAASPYGRQDHEKPIISRTVRTVCDDPAALEESRRHYYRRNGRFSGTVALLPGGAILRQRWADIAEPKGKGGGGSRGVIKGLSPTARRALMKKLMAFPWQSYTAGKRAAFARAAFVTLTYPDLYPSLGLEAGGQIDRQKIKRDLDTLRKRLSRFPAWAGMLWKMEIEPRKSGTCKGCFAPHFHCIVTFRHKTHMQAFRRWIAGAWAEVVDSTDPKHRKAGTRVDSIFNPGTGRLMNYLGKYVGKEFDGRMETGRCYGIMGDFPQEAPRLLSCDNYTAWEFVAEGVREWGGKSRFRHFQPYFTGATLYGDPAEFLEIFGRILTEDHPEPLTDYRKKHLRSLCGILAKIGNRKPNC